MKKYNFSAGPSILAKNVIKEAAKSVSELNNIGLSLLEISHRSQDFIDIIHEAKRLTKNYLTFRTTTKYCFYREVLVYNSTCLHLIFHNKMEVY